MKAAGIHAVELILLLMMISVVALAALAKRLETPYPIIMVIGGLIISFVPHVPKVALNPDIVFLVILPPLLFSSAYVTSCTPGVMQGALQLLWLVFGSIMIGLAAGKVIRLMETHIEDAAIKITLSLVAPYFAYLAGESAHSSGVLATVVCGMYLGHHSSLYLSTGARLTGDAVWRTLTFILNGFVFLLIGFQLPYLLPMVRVAGLAKMLRYELLLSVVLILLRLIWMYPGAEVAYQIRTKLLHQEVTRANPRAIFIVGWTGMRGVVAVAAAIALPNVIANGERFPHREVMIFLTFCVIFVTLVLQGLTLPPLIRRLGLAGAGGRNLNEEQARRAMIDSALTYLEYTRETDDPAYESMYSDMIVFQKRRRELLEADSAGEDRAPSERMEKYRDLLSRVRAVQRATILHMRNQGEIDDEVMRRLERELDLVEVRFSSAGAL